ncbi:MAG: IS200/IS605 family transposase [Acidobacteria bacterium]|nr:IS200/IS605 family transposase [Acidobacteriota bacterium]
MPQSLSSILVHLIFSTKERQPYITPAIEPELHAYMATIFRALKSPAISIGGTKDHVHSLFTLSRTVSVADLVEEVKKSSSKWMKTKGNEFRHFQWQRGYGAFSIGQSNVAALLKYIRDQKGHHRQRTFQEEFRTFLAKYRIECDERYVWD